MFPARQLPEATYLNVVLNTQAAGLPLINRGVRTLLQAKARNDVQYHKTVIHRQASKKFYPLLAASEALLYLSALCPADIYSLFHHFLGS